MKTCPHCDTMMEEQAGSGGEMLKIPNSSLMISRRP
jgi:hypothetical protein